MATVVVPPGTKDLSTVDPGSGTDPHAWFFYEGDQEITAGTNFSARAAQTSVFIDKSAPVRITATLRLGIVSSFITEAIGGFCSIQADDSGSNTIASFRLRGGMKVVDVGGGTWTDVQASSGNLTIHDSTLVTNLDVSGGTHTIGYNATGMTSFSARSGVVYCRRGMAADKTVTVDGDAVVIFRRAQMVASPGITITDGDGVLRIGGRGVVKWCGGVIDKVELDSDDAVFDWRDMPAAATIPLITGSAKAIGKVGLRQGAVNTLRNGAILTVTTLTPKGGDPEAYYLGSESYVDGTL